MLTFGEDANVAAADNCGDTAMYDIRGFLLRQSSAFVWTHQNRRSAPEYICNNIKQHVQWGSNLTFRT